MCPPGAFPHQAAFAFLFCPHGSLGLVYAKTPLFPTVSSQDKWRGVSRDHPFEFSIRAEGDRQREDLLSGIMRARCSTPFPFLVTR